MQIIMPKLGLTMTEGTITEWLKAPGDSVESGEVLFNYETEKVTLDYEAPADGVLMEIVAPAGVVIPAGGVVCVFQTASERQAAASSVAGDEARRARQIVATPKARRLAAQWKLELASLVGRGPEGRVQAIDVELAHASSGLPEVGTSPIASEEEIKATPVARRVAEARGVNLSQVQGSGPAGRVIRADVERVASVSVAADAPSVAAGGGRTPIVAPPTETIIPLKGVRQVIAQRMAESAFSAPHVTLFTEAEATNLVSARAQLNQGLPREDRVSYNALLAAVVARALRDHPILNARLEADGIHVLPAINLALAVDTERGLMTPVLRQVDQLSLLAIQRGYAALVERALTGTSLPDDFADGTFTITNLGPMDVDGFTPIINPPQAAILGVGRIIEKPVAREGAVVVRSMIVLSLSFDHRVVDGGPAARFLQRIKQLVETPVALLL